MEIPGVTTIAGCGNFGYSDGRMSKARFREPCGINVDAVGNIWIIDSGNHCIRKISVNGIVSTVAGDGTAGFEDGPGSTARFSFQNNYAFGPAFDRGGNIIVPDVDNHRIRKISIDGTVSTVAGTGEDGYLDGPAQSAQFRNPTGVAVDADGNIIVSDGNHCIRKITHDGTVSTLAGIKEKGYFDGQGALARFNDPNAIVVDSNGNILVSDTGNHSIRKITPSGEVTTLAGNGKAGKETGSGDSCLKCPMGLAVDGDDNAIVADKDNLRIAKINSEGIILSKIVHGQEDKSSMNVPFEKPLGVAIDREGSILMFDDNERYLYSIDAKLRPPQQSPTHGAPAEVNGARLLSMHKSRSEYCDVDIHVGNTVFPAHRIILAQSPFFKACFAEEFCESTDRKVVLEDVTTVAFKLVLDYLYTENWTFPSDCDVLLLRSTAEFFMLSQLQQRCETEIQKRLCSDNLVRCLRYAKTNSMNGLKRQCIDLASSSAAELSRVIMTKDCTAMFQEDAELSKEFLAECEESDR